MIYTYTIFWLYRKLYYYTVGEPSSPLSIDSVVVSNMVTCYGEDNGFFKHFIVEV